MSAQIDNPGKLLPWTLADAKALAAKFPVLRTIGGWRADGGGFDDHPSGRALDIMVNNIPNGKAVGDAVVAELTTHPSEYNVDYLIWYGMSWNPRRGTWVPYHSTDDPHTTHVHLSTLKTAPAQGMAVPTALGSVGSSALARTFNLDQVMGQVQGATVTVTAALFGVALLGVGVVLTIRPRRKDGAS
jgi:hypothetical protein